MLSAAAQQDPAPPGLLVLDETLGPRAAALCGRFGLVRLDAPPARGFHLCLRPQGLELRQAGPRVPGPVRVDFLAGALAHRLRYGGGRGRPLARAVGMKAGFSPEIWDATAGLGRDGAVLAYLGSRVTLCERSPVPAALLDDALLRAAGDETTAPWVERLRLRFADSTTALGALPAAERPEVIYLDPMYPPGKADALVKKDMRALQQLLGGDRDSAGLLDAALAAATRRVVVKRPKRAGWLSDRPPSACIESRNTRYDIYLVP